MANKNSKKNNYPKNIGIIMDGNGRWALKNSLKISQGHKHGVDIVRDIVEESLKQNIKSLTLYAFSSENWKRPKAEINAIKRLIIQAINKQVPELKEQKVRLKFFGHLNDFGKKIIDKITYAENETKCKSCKLNLNIALGYGGQQDILDVVLKISKKISSGKIDLKDINMKLINDFSSVPVDQIDLLIRTGGDKRVSNFLLYQIAYAEIMFIDKFWPDFTKDDFVSCLDNFNNVSRRFGKRI
tara:strand:+ start:6372 stop:7097 length:726 start_codon:yes stop_codon:yes gene_type:complete